MLALVVALVVCDPVTVELHYMPPGVKVYLPPPNNTWGKGFSFEEYKLLLKLDGDLWDANQSLAIYKDLDLKYREVVEQKDVIIQTLLADKQVLGEQLRRAEENWHAAERRTIEAPGGPV